MHLKDKSFKLERRLKSGQLGYRHKRGKVSVLGYVMGLSLNIQLKGEFRCFLHELVVTSYVFRRFIVIKAILALYVTANTIEPREKSLFIDAHCVQLMKYWLLPICINYEAE